MREPIPRFPAPPSRLCDARTRNRASHTTTAALHHAGKAPAHRRHGRAQVNDAHAWPPTPEYSCIAVLYGECPHMPPTGSSWIAVALISASVVHAARGPSPLTVRLIVGHGAGVSGEPRPGRPDAAGTRGRLLDGRLPTGCLETPGDPGQAEGCQPGIIQQARLRQAVRPPERRGGARQCVPGRRGAARCGFPACPRPATPSR